MSVTITVKDNSPELLQKVMVAVGRFVRKAAFFIEGQIKTSMAAAKHGHQYGAHVASAPGESPAIDSSNLVGSIHTIFPSTLEAKIGTPVAYAAFLESGTSRMAARPVWQKTVSENLPTLESLLRQEVHAL